MPPFDTIKLKARGQLVIPAGLREGFKEGEELVAIRVENRLILEQASAMTDEDKEDLEFARRTEEAWKEIERGEYVEMDWDEFLEDLKTW